MTYLPNGTPSLQAKVPSKISNISGGYVLSYGIVDPIIYGYITFFSSGNITFKKNTQVSCLIVGGGGGGGGGNGGYGGGAGGLVAVTTTFSAATAYAITVGAGGAGGVSTGGGGYNGGSSSISNTGYIAYGGGGGAAPGGSYINTSNPVGSGGGTYTSANRKAPTSGQGNYGGYYITGGSGPPGYGGWSCWGAGGGYANSPADVATTWSSNYDNATHTGPTIAASVGGDSTTIDAYDPCINISLNSAGYNWKYRVENQGLISQIDWDSGTGTNITNSGVGTIFTSRTNNYYLYNRTVGYVSLVRSFAGGGGAPSMGNWTPGNTGGFGSGGNSVHDTWATGSGGGQSGQGGTGGGGGGGWNAAGGSGGSGIVVLRYLLVDMSTV